MNLENIKYFISVAECLNFTQAAEKEHMTQTSMSRKISGMEDELGVQLFYRDNHQVALTEAGHEFYVQSQKLIELYQFSVQATQNIHHGFTTAMKIGVGIYEHVLLSPFLGVYTAKYPSVRISCLQYGYHELLKRFEQGLLDLIISSDQFLTGISWKDWDVELVHEKDWVLGIHKNHPLAACDKIASKSMSSETLITMYSGSISQVIDHYKNAFHFRDIIHVNSFATKLLMIDANLGVGVIPEFFTLNQYDSICVKPFQIPYKPRRFYILCRKNHPNFYVHDFFRNYLEFIMQMRS